MGTVDASSTLIQPNRKGIEMKNAIKNAIINANAAYVARKGAQANVNKAGINPDLSKALAIAESLTDGQEKAIKALGIESRLIAGLKDSTNTKKPMRIMQALLFTVSGDGAHLKGSARTFLLEFCGLVIAGAKNREALAFCATGKGNENTSDSVSVTKARAIMRAFGNVGISTEQTQNSVSFSRGGIADTLGVAMKEKRTGLPVVDLSNKVAQALDEMVKGMTDNKLALIVAQSSGKNK